MEVLVLVDDVAGESGCEEAHDVGEPVGDAQKGTRVVGRHVNMGTHKSYIIKKSLCVWTAVVEEVREYNDKEMYVSKKVLRVLSYIFLRRFTSNQNMKEQKTSVMNGYLSSERRLFHPQETKIWQWQ